MISFVSGKSSCILIAWSPVIGKHGWFTMMVSLWGIIDPLMSKAATPVGAINLKTLSFLKIVFADWTIALIKVDFHVPALQTIKRIGSPLCKDLMTKLCGRRCFGDSWSMLTEWQYLQLKLMYHGLLVKHLEQISFQYQYWDIVCSRSPQL